MVRRKERSELELAEIKLETLVQRRDALNAEASQIREERDLINDRRRETMGEVRSLREARRKALDGLHEHKALRNELQSRAKALIDLKRTTGRLVQTSVRDSLNSARRELHRMELRQQTSSLTLGEENALLEAIRSRLKEVRELEALQTEQDKVVREVKDLDASITELFRSADTEHEFVLRLSSDSEKIREKIAALLDGVASVTAEADKKHDEYLKARGRADEAHRKVLEMREHVLTTREASRAEAREARSLVRQQNVSVRRELLDQGKLDRAAEDALRLLLAKGRVEIKG